MRGLKARVAKLERLAAERGGVVARVNAAALAPAALPAGVGEKDFLAEVVRAARGNGWLVYHTFDSRRSGAGFPDVVAVRGPRLVVAELKTAAGRLSAAQRAWCAALADAGAEVYVWRPASWPDVARVLGA